MTATENPTKTTFKLDETNLIPKQNFLNLDTGEMEEKTVASTKYELPTYKPGIHGSKDEFYANALEAATALVQPITDQIDAFLKYATSQSYQAGKADAMKGGKYLTPELKSSITKFLGNMPKFSELTGKDIFAMWLAGYKGENGEAKQAAAKKVLAIVSDSFDVEL